MLGQESTSQLPEHLKRPDLECYQCRRIFAQNEIAYIQNFRYDTLIADDFYAYLCAQCGNGEEKVHRLNLEWDDVVLIAMLNLGANGENEESKYFSVPEVKEFLDEHWDIFWILDKAKLCESSIMESLKAPFYISNETETAWTVNATKLYNGKILKRHVEYDIDKEGLLYKNSKLVESQNQNFDIGYFESTKIPPFLCQKCGTLFDQDRIGLLDDWDYDPLLGDNLYVYECKECSNGSDALYRLQMTWSDVVTVSLFNLILTETPKAVLNGIHFFDLQTQICDFASKNWNKMMRFPKPGAAKLVAALKNTLTKDGYIVLAKTVDADPKLRKCSWYGIDTEKFIESQSVASRAKKIESLVGKDGTLLPIPQMQPTTTIPIPKKKRSSSENVDLTKSKTKKAKDITQFENANASANTANNNWSFEQIKLRGDIIIAALGQGKSNAEIKELLELAGLP